MYGEFRSDPKVRTMTDSQQIQLVRLFCLRSDGPTENLSLDELRDGLNISDDETFRETKSVFLRKGFIDEKWCLANWGKRQFLSDSSTERVREFRKKRAMKRDVTVDETLHVTKATSALDSANTALKQDETFHETTPVTDQNRTEQNRTEQKELTLLPFGNGVAPKKLRPEEFANEWNRRRGPLPKVEKFTDGRRKKVQARLNAGVTLERFIAAVESCRTKPFLMGQNDRGWTADFDWLVANSENIEKAITNPYGLNKNGNGQPKPKTQYEIARDEQLAERRTLLDKVQ
jgi:hypothetical protein